MSRKGSAETDSARTSGESKSPFAYCKIFPGIGVARVGNSPEEYFVGPEVPGVAALPEEGKFKDANGRIKRQAARFRIYAFDAEDNVVAELTSCHADVARIEWTVGLANKKAAWHRFQGAQRVANVVANTEPIPDLRNRDIEGTDRERLNIVAPEASIAGINQSVSPLEGSIEFRDEKSKQNESKSESEDNRATKVYLGELKTDDKGRLIVLGGHGESGTVTGQFNNPLRHYANNERWYDDTSDGPVSATVRLKVGAKEENLQVRGNGWVIVAPPDFSPHTENVTTVYDVAVQAALDHKLKWNPKEFGPKPSLSTVSFAKDIYPILRRLTMYQWVSDKAHRGHSKGKGGDFLDPSILKTLANPKKAAQAKSLHKRIFDRIRTPLQYPLMPPAKKDLLNPKSQEAKNQACLNFMPPISGDEGDAKHEAPLTWQTITEQQYSLLKKWKDGEFVGDWVKTASMEPPSFECIPCAEQPAALIRAALDACQGGPFFPGIEITSICRHEQFYKEPFRVSDSCQAGDITKWMALPWQADFYLCQHHWWPTVRPDEVVSVRVFEDVVAEFELETQAKDIASLLVAREPWARGIGGQAIGRPGLPGARASDTPSTYHKRASEQLESIVDLFVGERWFLAYYRVDKETAEQYRNRVKKLILTDIGFTLPEVIAGETTRAYQARAMFELRAHLMHAVDLPAPEKGESTAEYAKRASTFADNNEVAEALITREWRSRNRNSGMNDMLTTVDGEGEVPKWTKLGFVTRQSTKSGEVVYVESDRNRYDLLSPRDYFYILMNEEEYPDFTPKARELAEEFLREGRSAYAGFEATVSGHLYAPFKYSENAFHARMEKIYESNRRAAKAFNPITGEGTIFQTPEQLVQRIRQLAPFNQLDGSWLRNINNAGPIDEVGAFLSEIWMDEIGNGDPAQNHANIYTDLLHSAGIYLPPLNSRAYADHPDIWEESYMGPVYHHSISKFPEFYFPELLGMTLYLEWEANFLAAMVKLYEYHGYNSLFYSLHVAIDNTVDGHAAKARDAVKLYLDHIRIESGEAEMQEQWQRVWNGYISFATVGGSNWRYRFENPPSIRTQMFAMIERKRHYGQLNHGSRKLGVNFINSWFDDPSGFLAELQESDLIVKGNWRKSRIFDLMGTRGPMLKVFTPGEVQLWKDWINSLDKVDGSGLDLGQAVRVLLQEMRGRGIAEIAHENYKLTGPNPDANSPTKEVTKPVSWWFQLGKPELFMKALINPKNGWIIPGDVEQSRFVSELLSDEGSMARRLISTVPEAGDRTGRQILIDWIAAKCPEPGRKKASSESVELESEKLSPVAEQERWEEAVGLIRAIPTTQEQRAEFRARFYGPGAGACH